MNGPVDYAVALNASLLQFVKLRQDAYRLMEEAAKLPHLPELLRRQALSAAYLCGVTMHRVRGEPGALDAKALVDELLHLARRCVDPLVEAIGEEACESFRNIDAALFKDQLLGAVEGNATHALEEAARDINESWQETVAEKAREFMRAE